MSTPGAFKDSKGLSVDRDVDRSEPEVISAINKRLPLLRNPGFYSLQGQSQSRAQVKAFLSIPDAPYREKIIDRYIALISSSQKTINRDDFSIRYSHN
jgi:hypothetical protein